MRRAYGTAPVPNRVVLDVARTVPADARTVRRVIDGLPVRGAIGPRVRRELERRGLLPQTLGLSEEPPEPVPPGKEPTGMERRGYIRRKYWVPRMGAEGERPMSLGAEPLNRWERAELEEIESELRAAGVSLERPRTLADCPPEGTPCPWAGCRHNLAIEVLPNPRAGRPGFLKINFPGRGPDELPETCSLRVAARAAQRVATKDGHGLPSARALPAAPAMSCTEVGRFMGLATERVRQIQQSALAKLRLLASEMEPPA